MNKLEEIGLKVFENFITPEEETELLKKINKSETRKPTKGRNKIQRFGSKKPYNTNMVSSELPEHFNFIIDRIMEKNLLPIRPNSISINEYFVDQTIEPHVDSEASGKTITILSLLSDAKMEFSKLKEKIEFDYPARCLIQLNDEIRWKWTHAILPVKALRYS